MDIMTGFIAVLVPKCVRGDNIDVLWLKVTTTTTTTYNLFKYLTALFFTRKIEK